MRALEAVLVHGELGLRAQGSKASLSSQTAEVFRKYGGRSSATKKTYEEEENDQLYLVDFLEDLPRPDFAVLVVHHP